MNPPPRIVATRVIMLSGSRRDLVSPDAEMPRGRLRSALFRLKLRALCVLFLGWLRIGGLHSSACRVARACGLSDELSSRIVSDISCIVC